MLTFASTAWSSRLREPLPGDPGGEGVVRDPVRPADEDRDVVDDQGVRRAVPRRGVVSSRTARKPIERSHRVELRPVLRGERHVERVAAAARRTRAATTGPASGTCSRSTASLACRRDRARCRCPPATAVRMTGRAGVRVRSRRTWTSTVPSTAAGRSARPPSPVDGPRRAGRPTSGAARSACQMPAVTSGRAPVPAEVAGHLADEVERLVVGRRPAHRAGRACACGVLVRGVEADLQRVVARAQRVGGRRSGSRGACSAVRPDLDVVERSTVATVSRPAQTRSTRSPVGRVPLRTSSRTPRSVWPIQASRVSLSSRNGSAISPAASRSVWTHPGTVAGTRSPASRSGTLRTADGPNGPAVVQCGAAITLHRAFHDAADDLPAAEEQQRPAAARSPANAPASTRR